MKSWIKYDKAWEGSTLVVDPTARPIRPVVGKRGPEGGGVSWNNNASQDGRLTMEVSPDQPLPKLVVLARGIQAQLYSSTTGKPVRGLMPREQALRIARIFA